MIFPNDDQLKDNIQKNLIFYRKKAKVTQKDLADKLGVAATTVSGWERGATSPDIDTLLVLSFFVVLCRFPVVSLACFDSLYKFPSVICTLCTGFFCLAIIKGPPNDIYFIIEGPCDGYFTEKVSQAHFFETKCF